MRRILCAVLLLLCFFSNAVAELEVHFLNVGQADAAVILCDGHAMMIDGGNVGDSQLIFSYLKNTLALDHLDIMIATHPHEDHIGGLPAALNAVTTGVVLSPVNEFDSEVFGDLKKYATCGLTVPTIGDTFQLGGAAVTVINVTDTTYETVNDWSIVVRIDYGDTSFLFTGDASSLAESDMLTRNENLDCDVLKVGHHGSSSSSTMPFLQAVSPEYAIISVGIDNAYGHPTSDVLERLNAIGAIIHRTDQRGHIICKSNGSTIEFSFQKEYVDAPPYEMPPDEMQAQPPEEYLYVGNSNSMKLHYPSCESVRSISEKNKVYFDSYDDAISQGYEPCGNCNP